MPGAEPPMAAEAGLPEAMLDPAAYPHAVEGAVRLITTHISWVLVAPPWAWKIKRPVVFDFLDFRALADRRRFCEDELRLNRRFAPALYHDVVPVVRTAAGLRFGGEGEVVDYAVCMAAFEPDEELKVLVESGRVEAGELAVLAADLAAFQAQAEVCASGTFGDPAVLERAAAATFAVLSRSPAVPAAMLAALEDWSRANAAALGGLRAERRRAGRVRDGHGDLHAGNVVRWGGRLVPFDCLEFDAGLRGLDVIADVAFLFMDLASRGRRDLAQAFLDAWLEATGDYAALRLLPWHVVYYSLVRAKVDALQLREAAGERAAALRTRLAQHLALAQTWTAPASRRLVLMHGVSGSGKSWLAARLVPLLPAVRVRADVERKRLAGLGFADRSGSALGAGLYTADSTARTYEHLAGCAEAALAAGDVIVDATFLDSTRRAPFLALARRNGAAFVIVDCAPDAAVCRARVAKRESTGGDPSEAGLAVLADQLARQEPLAPEELPFVVKVTDAQPDPSAVAAAIAGQARLPVSSGR